MHELVDADMPFERQLVPLDEAIEYFKSKGLQDKVQLLKYRQKEYLVLYRLGDHQDYHHGYMVPSTGYLKWFGLESMGEGFCAAFPTAWVTKEDHSHAELSETIEHFQAVWELVKSTGDRICGGVK